MMQSALGLRKKVRSGSQDVAPVVNPKTSVTCTNVPEGLFDASCAKKHFSKFGRVQKIRLFPKRQMCIIEYDQQSGVDKAVLNAGAYDGFMFDVTRYKPKMRRRSKKDDDPDWVPDSDVEEELSAMSGTPTYRTPRQKSMEVEAQQIPKPTPLRFTKSSPVQKKVIPVKERVTSGIESPVLVTSIATSMSTAEAAAELHQLRFKISLTPDEQWRTLDARDRILRGWGGAGARVKVGGATIGTCPDMCPEKERLHRQAEYQVMTLETVPGSDGQLEPRLAVKQYSRSSADQEIPLCYELRPAPVLRRTAAYLLRRVADTDRQVSLADWFHFMWDRLRSIRKDITQQALCCAESVELVEACARFHVHCGARLAGLAHAHFDQKLNTDNLAKCLQTLKHMYADALPALKPREAEFRGYIALLNLGDSNFWWEIKQLPQEIQKSEAITFAIQVFNALDNNNYVRFFRLIKEKATYLQACILLRYFNDVRARALARIVKAYAPRGGSRFPAQDLMNALAFESYENMKSFIEHYGLRFAKADDYEITIILDRNLFIEDSDPYPISRAQRLIESKRTCSVGEVIAGGQLPFDDFDVHNLYTSFNKDGTLKESALMAEDLNYSTLNDSNKDINALKLEVQKLAKGGKCSTTLIDNKPVTSRTPTTIHSLLPVNTSLEKKLFSFQPAIPVAPVEIINNSPEKIFEQNSKNTFTFSKPHGTNETNIFKDKLTENIFRPSIEKLQPNSKSLFHNVSKENENQNLFNNAQNIFKTALKTESHGLNKESTSVTVFGHQNKTEANNIFSKMSSQNNVFAKTGHVLATSGTHSLFDTKFSGTNLFTKPENTAVKNERSNLFADAVAAKGDLKTSNSVFNSVKKSDESNVFSRLGTKQNPFAVNGDTCNEKLPSSLFKTAVVSNSTDDKKYSIFQSKNKISSVADTIFNSVNESANSTVYDFKQNDIEFKTMEMQRLKEIEQKEKERKMQDEQRKLAEDEMKAAARRKLLEEEEQRKKQEERRKEEERKRKELKLKEDQRIAEQEALEKEKKFKEKVEKESELLVNELILELNDETVLDELKAETDIFKKLIAFAAELTNQILLENCEEICSLEMRAEKFLTKKIRKKWFYTWKKHYIRNLKRRNLLENTPIWLPAKTPHEEALCLRRQVENFALKNMNAWHTGYRFKGELRQWPPFEAFNLMEIIKSPLLKRMKEINYAYDKCFFWKVTLVTSGIKKWLYKKLDIEEWLIKVFSDTKRHETSETLIQVGKHSWNNLMDFAISVSIANKENQFVCNEAVEGTNGILFYATDIDSNYLKIVHEVMSSKFPLQIVPIALIMPKLQDESLQRSIEELFSDYVKQNIISAFRIFIVDSQNILNSLNVCTKTALRWLAKNCPQNPPIEIDYVKSLCETFLGNDLWYRLKIGAHVINTLSDINTLIAFYNSVVDKLSNVITDEDLFNYSTFPLEFVVYLETTLPYPKTYEFIPSNVKNADNISEILDILRKLKLPKPETQMAELSVMNIEDQILTYCKEIGCFTKPEQVVCKAVAILPNDLTDLTMASQGSESFVLENCNPLDLLNIIVYEKIKRLSFSNVFAIYKRSVLEQFRNYDLLNDFIVRSTSKHKAIDFDDDLDLYIQTKRHKKEQDSMEYLVMEDKDSTLVEENLKATDQSISKYSNCENAVKQLEGKIEQERLKSIELENLLRAALSDV